MLTEQGKKLSELEMELAAARQEGFSAKSLTVDTDDGNLNKRTLVVIGIVTMFGRKNNRNAIRKAWMGNGKLLSFSISSLCFSFFA